MPMGTILNLPINNSPDYTTLLRCMYCNTENLSRQVFLHAGIPHGNPPGHRNTNQPLSSSDLSRRPNSNDIVVTEKCSYAPPVRIGIRWAIIVMTVICHEYGLMSFPG
jgi:hypothetical protein